MRDLQYAQPTPNVGALIGGARALRESGQYRAAVHAYDKIIERFPRVHTNYIGRAKARYLDGDKRGALADLDTAQEIFDGDPAIENLRTEITSGEAVTTALPSTPKEKVSLGNQALASGNPTQAEEHFVHAEELGAHRYFSQFNRAMAKCLSGDLSASKLILDDFQVNSDSYMAVNKEGLLAICAALGGQSTADRMKTLHDLIARNQFDYGKSPLRFLESGLQMKVPDRIAELAPIFNLLKNRSRAAASDSVSAPYSGIPRPANPG